MDSKILLSQPHRLTSHSFWHEHIPFGMWIIEVVRPHVIVELGTHHGDSFCAFCQAVRELGLQTRCFAVDSWRGDIHTGDYGPEVLSDLRQYHDARYADFSTLLQSTFDAALEKFQAGTIDLLHIDGTHTYEAVKRDFETWLPKMSERGVVLLHDTNVLEGDFGVRKYFDEIRGNYRHFEFLHGYGLGVLLVGDRTTSELKWLTSADGVTTWKIRRFFFQQGERIRLQAQILGLKRTQAELQSYMYENKILAEELSAYQREAEDLRNDLDTIVGSRGWKLLQGLWTFKRLISTKSNRAENTVPELSESPLIVASNKDHNEVSTEESTGKILNTISEMSAPNNDAPPEVFEQLSETTSLTLTDLTPNDDVIALTSKDVRLIAFYLPQFHPIPENDRWWGKGFTEWRNVAKARPNFEKHYQPRLPADLGFYDLRVPETREHQANLASKYGIFGFCYYYYWFGGKRLLERPFDEVLKSKRPDFPFCICWANENWSRRWDGLDHEILIAQNHSPEDDRNFIASLLPAFRDERYIRVDGKPLLLVYRPYLLPNAARTVEIWREKCQHEGLGEIYLAALEEFTSDLWAYGFDAAFEFPPHGLGGENLLNEVRNKNSEYEGIVVDYVKTSQAMIDKPATDYVLFRGVMPSWDNTPRRQNDSLIFLNSSPETYKSWLRKSIELTITRNRGDERIVFINAWNEWAEGAYLEPDNLYGHQYLQATRDAMVIDSRLSNLLKATSTRLP